MGDVSFFADKKNKLRRFGSGLAHRARRERPVVVALTSYPARIATAHQSIRSLFGQSRLPDKIVLYLAEQDFPNREADLPEPLTSMLWRDFEIHWVPRDLKSHKKYYWAFEEFSDCLVVTVDDDLIYRRTMLAELVEAHAVHPKAVIASRAHLMTFYDDGELKPYDEWISFAAMEHPALVGTLSMRHFATTGAGTLFVPEILPELVHNVSIIEECCLYADDLWLKVVEAAAGIPVVVATTEQGLVFVDGTQEQGLWVTRNSCGGNDDALSKILANPIVQEQLPAPLNELVRDDSLDGLL